MNIKISKGEEIIDAEEVFKKRVTKFSNSAHIILPIGYLDKDATVIIEKTPMTNVKTANAKQKKDGTWKIGKVKP